MDFLQKYQHRIQRLVSRGLVVLGLPTVPKTVVVDVRNGKSIDSYMYNSLVSILEQMPSCRVVFWVDQSSDISLLTPFVRFAHRLDCAVTLRSYDVIVEMPKGIVSRYIYCVSKWSIQESLTPSVSFSHFCVEVEYNVHTAPHIHGIMSFFDEAEERKVVLPEYASALPNDDFALQNWLRINPSNTSLLNTNFLKEIHDLRNTISEDKPGFVSRKTCHMSETSL